MLMLFMGSLVRAELPQSARAMVVGRVMGLPKENVSNFQVVLVSEGGPCAVLKTHALADGSFRFSSVRAGDYRVAVSGLPEGYGLKTMTAGVVNLFFNAVRLMGATSTQVLIEVTTVEDIRRGMSPVVRVGDGLRSPPCLMHQVKPVYPSQAKAARIVGDVIVSVGIDENGYVKDVMVVEGYPLLIQSAIDAVRQERYAPYVFRGEMIPVKTTVLVPFRLK